MAQTARRRRFHVRSFVSFTILLSFLALAFSGVVLYLAPPGGVARATRWTYLGLGRDGWMAQHITSCAVFVVFALVHLYLNWRPLWSYVYSKLTRGFRRKWEGLAALLLAVFLVAGTIYELPPWSFLLEGSRHLQSYRREARQLRQRRGLGGRRGRRPGGGRRGGFRQEDQRPGFHDRAEEH